MISLIVIQDSNDLVHLVTVDVMTQHFVGKYHMQIVVKELQRLKWDVIGLAELRWKDSRSPGSW